MSSEILEATIEGSAAANDEFDVLCGLGPKVAVVIPGNSDGSGFVFARRQAESLRAKGLRIHVIFFDSRLSLVGIGKNCCAIRRAVRQFQPDVLHVHYGTVTAFVSAYATRLPLVITFHGSDLQPEPGINKLRTAVAVILSQLAVLRARRIICVSQDLKARLWWRRQVVTVLPIGVNLEQFKPQSKCEARKLLGWDEDEPTVLFNAGTAPITKGSDLAEAAIRELRLRRPHVRMEVMRGDVAPDRVPLLMNAADCLLVTSRSEGSPTVVKEALACNLPVVSVDVGDVRERLRDVTPSYIVERDPHRIATALTDILSLGSRSNGREYIAHVSETRIAQTLCSIYKAISVGHVQSEAKA